ncbi:MAG TPA: hypothetical protein VEB21_13080 [Terriglobales bacterium]|nr:hypothetical protein [Terriglobales bacterium]
MGERWFETPILLRTSAFCRSQDDYERASQYMAVAQRLSEVQFKSEVWCELGEISFAQSRAVGAVDASGEVRKAEYFLEHAITLARAQKAILAEARAAIVVARVQITTDRRAQALSLISEIHRRFPPTENSADMDDLEALLHELR